MSTEVESGNTQPAAAQVPDASAQPTDAQTQAGEAKPAEAAKPADAKPAEPKPAVEYQPFKTPEGAKLSEGVLGKFTELAKASNLSQEAAQAMIDNLAPLIAKEQMDSFNNILSDARKQWLEETKTDKELGGEKFDENLAIASSVVSKFGTPALKEFLDKSGLGDHPEMIRFAHKIGKQLGEDVIIRGALPADTGAKDTASVLYGNANAA